jgi:outer membrane protein OmpA-like peptidoglycan-associated protein
MRQSTIFTFALLLFFVTSPTKLCSSTSLGTTGASPLQSRATSQFDDFLPCYHASTQTLWFTSNRAGGMDRMGRGALYMDDIYIAEDMGEGAVALAGFPLNSTASDGAPAFSADGRTLIFSGSLPQNTSLDLMQSHFVDGAWQKPSYLPASVNSEAWDSQPTLAGSLLVFSSDRLGGLGGTDLWASTFENAAWGEAWNLGSKVNTAGDERAPHLSPSGRHLYFSRQVQGEGQSDFYLARRQRKGFNTPRLLPAPFNSPGDELGFCLLSDLQSACFSSRRQKHDFDLFTAVLPMAFRPIELPDFLQEPLRRGSIFELPIIEFAFASAQLPQEADSILSALLQILNLEPALQLRIEGHTDSIGQPLYNDSLSLKRAQAMKHWLLRHGIADERLQCRGFGSRIPVIDGSDKGARQRNRRIEVRVLQAP